MIKTSSLHVKSKKNVIMKAVAYQKSLPTDQPESRVDITLDRPAPGPRDLLVEVRAISVNPVDTKVRAGGGPPVRLGMVKGGSGGPPE
jgi:NADPH:quinone reductase-like Zn-dependent oxidoreductase